MEHKLYSLTLSMIIASGLNTSQAATLEVLSSPEEVRFSTLKTSRPGSPFELVDFGSTSASPKEAQKPKGAFSFSEQDEERLLGTEDRMSFIADQVRKELELSLTEGTFSVPGNLKEGEKEPILSSTIRLGQGNSPFAEMHTVLSGKRDKKNRIRAVLSHLSTVSDTLDRLIAQCGQNADKGIRV